MAIFINGKPIKEWENEERNNPNSDTVFWDNTAGGIIINYNRFVNGKMVYPDGIYGKSKCTYRGKTYEGVIEYKNNCLYVGGEFVKNMN